MTFVYDVEVFQNFFSITYQPIDKEWQRGFYIYKDNNQLHEIVNLFTGNNHWWVGYNSVAFDDPIIQHLIDNETRYADMDSDILTSRISSYASDVIDNKKSKYIDVDFNRFDLMRVGNLYKSLKMVAVNLKHDRIQDLPYPFYHEVKEDQVNEILEYNKNDVEITWKLYHELRDDIQLRADLTSRYGINLMNETNSGIANRILEKDYGKASGLPYYRFKQQNTERAWVDFEDCISDKIKFESDNLKKLLSNIKKDGADKNTNIEYHARIGRTKYDIKKGGIHSDMPSEIWESTEDEIIKEADVSSYYPNIMLQLGIKPEHLHDCFLPLLERYTSDRLKAKAENDDVASYVLKIVINSIFGKMGNEYHWLYDLKSLYETTLNGQLFLLMLVERLEGAGIPVFYANTDGINAMVPRELEDVYVDICEEWQDYTGFDLDYVNYDKCIIKDVNNYIWIPENSDKNKYKGFFDINRWKDVTKAFDKPVVPYAINEYFTKGIPVEEFITNHEDILDFCMAQKPGKKFDIEFHFIDDNNEMSVNDCQHANRYYVGKGGGSLYKSDDGKLTSMVAGQPVYLLNDVEVRDSDLYPVKYQYYIKEARKVIGQFKHKQQDLFL